MNFFLLLNFFFLHKFITFSSTTYQVRVAAKLHKKKKGLNFFYFFFLYMKYFYVNRRTLWMCYWLKPTSAKKTELWASWRRWISLGVGESAIFKFYFTCVYCWRMRLEPDLPPYHGHTKSGWTFSLFYVCTLYNIFIMRMTMFLSFHVFICRLLLMRFFRGTY